MWHIAAPHKAHNPRVAKPGCLLCPASTQAPAHTNGHMQGMHTRRNAVAASHHRTITSAQHSHTHAMPAITSTSLDPGTTHKQCTVQPQSKQAHTPALLLHPAAAPPPPLCKPHSQLPASFVLAAAELKNQARQSSPTPIRLQRNHPINQMADFINQSVVLWTVAAPRILRRPPRIALRPPTRARSAAC